MEKPPIKQPVNQLSTKDLRQVRGGVVTEKLGPDNVAAAKDPAYLTL